MTPDRLIEQTRSGWLPAPAQRRAIRLSAGVSLVDLAAALQVHKRTLERWEQGEISPRHGPRRVAYAQVLRQLGEPVGETS